MDFTQWVNVQINRFQNELKSKVRSSNDYKQYRDKFVNYCVECIEEYNNSLELESVLKQSIVSKSISLLKDAESLMYYIYETQNMSV